METRVPESIEAHVLRVLRESRSGEVRVVISRSSEATRRNTVRSFGLGDLSISEVYEEIERLVNEGVIDRRRVKSPADEDSNLMNGTIEEHAYALAND